ncbi:MAG TPA: hypothetical protein VLB46_14590 [Pyrinomonadaceae bacterium]|nr:hypothetical protein [Pyrinomonadaceae bacterium]
MFPRKFIYATFFLCFLVLIYASYAMAQKPVLISVQGADVASGSGLSEDPVVNANGRFVACRTVWGIRRS